MAKKLWFLHTWELRDGFGVPIEAMAGHVVQLGFDVFAPSRPSFAVEQTLTSIVESPLVNFLVATSHLDVARTVAQSWGIRYPANLWFMARLHDEASLRHTIQVLPDIPATVRGAWVDSWAHIYNGREFKEWERLAGLPLAALGAPRLTWIAANQTQMSPPGIAAMRTASNQYSVPVMDIGEWDGRWPIGYTPPILSKSLEESDGFELLV